MLPPRSQQDTATRSRLAHRRASPTSLSPPAAVAQAAALASVGRAPADERPSVAQPRLQDVDALNAERNRAWGRANQARGLAAKEYLDDRATPTGHPAAEKESRERNWTTADHSRWRRLALAAQDGPPLAAAARLTSVRGTGAKSQPAALPSPVGSRRRPQARSR
ncbi:hypothetical protein ACQPYA_14230 [Micromonospora sp. CA-263727]|uniref:hypothetical protein n=1 Tax=Micromonospora sp. CA-263727 TaxID=3239967 RepID=UPI003D8B0AF4